MIEKKINYLALGDSYTVGEAVTASYPRYLAKLIEELFFVKIEVNILAKTGWRSDELLQAFIESDFSARIPYNIVSVMIGVNNFYQKKSVSNFEDDLEKLIKLLLETVDHQSLFMLSIPDYGFTPTGEPNRKEIYEGINIYNEIIRKICEKFEVPFLYITDLTRKKSLEWVAHDGLHISEKCHQKIAERILSSFYFRMSEINSY